MDISVIVPTYKPKDYLWICLDSLKTQTFPHDRYEIILVLNGCSEPYYSQILDYIKKDILLENVRFVHTEQSGVSNARNIALDIACGEYITFIDDDDFVSPQYLQELYSNIDEETITIAYPYAFNDGCLTPQLSYMLTDVFSSCSTMLTYPISSKIRKFFSGPAMKLIPRKIINNRRFDLRFENGEDVLFMFLISDNFKKIKISSRDAIYYRRYRLGSATNKHRSYIKNAYDNFMSMSTLMWYFLQKPHKYNFLFFLTRVLGSFYSLVTGKY